MNRYTTFSFYHFHVHSCLQRSLFYRIYYLSQLENQLIIEKFYKALLKFENALIDFCHWDILEATAITAIHIGLIFNALLYTCAG